MQQYKDDLLASCLRLVLSLPHEMVVLHVASVVPALKVHNQQYALNMILLQRNLTSRGANYNFPISFIFFYLFQKCPCIEILEKYH